MSSRKYDVIIIGAGIGGLTCGCYLAKAGMKVLIIEQHYKAGGYCTSFMRKGFTFEAGAFEFSENDHFWGIMDELNIFKKIEIIQHEPRILIYTKDGIIEAGKSAEKILNELKLKFPNEAKSLCEFFKIIVNYEISYLYRNFKDISFEYLLNRFFKDINLKRILGIMASQIAVTPAKVSALSIITHFKTFVFAKGVYPKGGLQAFADSFAERFRELGGHLILSQLVKKIKVVNQKAHGVVLESGEEIYSDVVVSNADAKLTYLNLIGEENLKLDFLRRLKRLKPSASLFIVYLGIKKRLRHNFKSCQEIWDIPTYKFDDPFKRFRAENSFEDVNIFCYLPSFLDPDLVPKDCESLSVGFFTPFMTKKYWETRKQIFAQKVTERIKRIIPFSEKDIVVEEIAIPQTLKRYTLNNRGAFKGWAPILGQVDMSLMPSRTPINNLYMVGHWVTTAVGESGIPQAAYVGKRVAQTIVNKK